MRNETIGTLTAALALAAGLTLPIGAFAQPDDGVKSGDLLRPVPPPGTQPTKPTPTQPAGPTTPGAKPPATPGPALPQGDVFQFGPYAEPVKVKLLMDTIVDLLKIQVIGTDKALGDKDILLPTTLEIPRDKLLRFLALLLEQNGQVLSRDSVTGVYFVRPATEVIGGLGKDEFAMTRIIPTPGIRPSTLNAAVTVALRTSGAAGGAAAAPAAGPGSIAYLDDLGIIVMTDAPRRIQAVEELVKAITLEQSDTKWTRFKLRHVAAPAARTRILELQGRVARPGEAPPAAGAGAAGASATTGSLSNLADRLTQDFQDNALLFRGRAEETDLLRRMIELVDVPNGLIPKWYPVGGAANQLAQQGKRQGLGEIITLQRDSAPGAPQAAAAPGQPGNIASQDLGGGPVFVLDAEGRGFMYYGTEDQHRRVQRLEREFEELTKSEAVVYEFYKLRHAKSEETADLIRGLISNTVQASGGQSPLLPGGGNRQTNAATRRAQPGTTPTPAGAPIEGGSASEISQILASEDIFVLANPEQNTVVVKAPRRVQPIFARLIERLDQRRPQVYIEAKIVAISFSDDMRLAIETQLINNGGEDGVWRTLFNAPPGSPSSIPPSGNILTNPSINPLRGITMAIIKSDQVPIVITALQNVVDTRIVATPQLLVDDNAEAEVSVLDQQATTTTSQASSAGSTVTAFGGFEPAGPKLKVKPQISSGDYLRLSYEVELSNFVGDPPSAGVPANKQESKIKSESVTVPSDATIVIGGLTFEQVGKTVYQVPFIGDIPIIGQLFRDERTNKRNTTLYVFLTPRIMRDQYFEDLRLLTRGPLETAKVTEDLPMPEPSVIEVNDPRRQRRTPANDPPPPPEPTPSAMP